MGKETQNPTIPQTIYAQALVSSPNAHASMFGDGSAKISMDNIVDFYPKPETVYSAVIN